MKNKDFIIIFGLAFMLSACQTLQTTPNEAQQVQTWQAKGKLGVRYPKCPDDPSCGVEALSLSFLWRHKQGEDDVRLSAPFSAKVLEIRYLADENLIEWQENGVKKRLQAQDLAHLPWGFLPQMAGWLTGAPVHEEQLVRENLQAQGYYQKMKLRHEDYLLTLWVQHWQALP